MSKDTLFHDFFHNPQARGEYSGCNVSFGNNCFYSYYTVIGQKMRINKKKTALLLSYDTMSNTTSRHIKALRHACPYDNELIVYVPFIYGNSYGLRREEIVDRFEEIIERWINNLDGLKRKPNREVVNDLLWNYAKFRSLFRIKKSSNADELQEIISEIASTHKRIVDPVKAEKRRKAKERHKNHILSEFRHLSYMEKVRLLFAKENNNKLYELDSKSRDIARQAIYDELRCGLTNHASFVWLDGDTVRTSQYVTLSADVVRRVFATWRKRGIEKVKQVGNYALDAVATDFMKIGCHYIPMQNILELEKEINKESAQ